MPRHISLKEAEVLNRPYGSMHRLAVRAMGLRNHQLLFMTLNPMQSTSRHYHPQEEIYFILKGNPIFETATTEIAAQPSDTVIFLSNEAHQVINPSPKETCEILIAISPLYDPKDVTYLPELK